MSKFLVLPTILFSVGFYSVFSYNVIGSEIDLNGVVKEPFFLLGGGSLMILFSLIFFISYAIKQIFFRPKIS